METLTEMLDYYISACRRNPEPRVREKFFDQAFGATEMYARLNPQDETVVYDMWMTTYRPQFEQIVYGV